jgi:protein arginine N-methyltransferase 6
MDYFDAYEDLGVHRLMLNDQPRTLAYKQAIANAVRGKTVLDVGCGTGILSLFCAQSGARKVYAVEASKMALFARDIMANNEFASVVTVIHQRMEDVVLPEQVDVIVSEWVCDFPVFFSALSSCRWVSICCTSRCSSL